MMESNFRKEMTETAAKIMAEKKQKNRDRAEYWWEHYGKKKIERAAKRGKFHAFVYIYKSYSSEVCDMLQAKSFTMRYEYQNCFGFRRYKCRWD